MKSILALVVLSLAVMARENGKVGRGASGNKTRGLRKQTPEQRKKEKQIQHAFGMGVGDYIDRDELLKDIKGGK